VHFIDGKITAEQVAHGDGQFGYRLGVVAQLVVQTAGDHIGIADCFDFLHAELVGQFVE